MADETASSRPVLNPVLRFLKEPRPAGIIGRGKDERGVKTTRLTGQRKRLGEQFAAMAAGSDEVPQFASRVVVYAEMFEDSLATTWTPSDLFHPTRGARMLAPYKDGYLVEIHAEQLSNLAQIVRSSETIRDRVDISRVHSVRFYRGDEALLSLEINEIWNEAPSCDGGKGFILWFMPLADLQATEALLAKIADFREMEVLSPPPMLSLSADVERSTDLMIGEASIDGFQREFLVRARSDRLNAALREYRQTRRARTTAIVPSLEAFQHLVASGAIIRIEPIKALTVTSPGEGKEPPRPLPRQLEEMPIVGVVDGGLTAPSYLPAEAWRTQPPLVSNAYAEVKHGNRVTSLIVQGHDWNNNLKLPPLYCRVGTVQAIAKTRVGGAHPQALVDYVDAAMATHPETRVWNLSINQPHDCNSDMVSHLGHAFAELARKHGVLLVNSIGNKPGAWLRPPADCEAALTIGGRLHSAEGAPGAKCPVSQTGPGPSSLLKPDIAHFSHVRAIGGAIEAGSSFACALAAPLAAHTMHKLRDPSPDLVKALLIHRADGDGFDPHFGFGSPDAACLPWQCEPGSVTLHWNATLRPGAFYYWELPIPPTLQAAGRLRGRGRLTGILNPHPLVSDLAGPNYFSARLQTGVQYEHGDKIKNLLGSMEVDRAAEQTARKVEHKWCPVRHYVNDFSVRGKGFSGNTLRIYARVFTRDLYLYGYSRAEEVPALDAVFVLSLGSADGTDDLYDQLRQELGAFVEPSVIESNIDLDVS